MKVKMLWQGGSSYGCFDVTNPEDVEEFDSIKDAVRSFERRADFDPYYPCVDNCPPEDGGPSAWLFFGEVGDYPDRVLEFGPRGGVRVIRA